VAPITLITPARFASEIKDGTVVSAAGWGLTAPNGNELPETLKVVHGPGSHKARSGRHRRQQNADRLNRPEGDLRGRQRRTVHRLERGRDRKHHRGPANACNQTLAQRIPAVYGWIKETIGPEVASSPASADATVGYTASFTAACSGKPQPTLRWQLSTNGGTSFTNIEAATGPTYVTPTTTLAMSGYK
jgi:hypothetical protein